MLLRVIIIGIIVYILWRLFRWKIHEDTIVCYTGGVGAGKSYMSAVTVRRAYKQQMRVWKTVKHLPGYEEQPLVYSSIPYQYAKGKWATKLVEEHLLLQRRIRPLSVVYIDEIDVFANQFQYNNPCIVNTKGGKLDGNFDEFCRLYRHYTRGGRMVCNAQALDNLNLTIRRRLNVEVNLAGIRVSGFGPLTHYKVFFRHRTGNIEVTNGKNDVINDYAIQRGIIFPGYKMYDTYCYSRRYERVPYKPEEVFNEWKLDDPITAPYGRELKYTVIVPGDVIEEPIKKKKTTKESVKEEKNDVETSEEKESEENIDV